MPNRLWITAFLLLWFVSASAQYNRHGATEKILRINPAAVQADSGLVEGVVVSTGRFDANFTRLEFSLRVITRGTNDSLNVYVQTSADPEDTAAAPWQHLTNFGVKTAIATTNFAFPTAVAARDSVAVVFPYYRVVEDHAPGTTGNSHAAADTSTWSLIIQQRSP